MKKKELAKRLAAAEGRINDLDDSLWKLLSRVELLEAGGPLPWKVSRETPSPHSPLCPSPAAYRTVEDYLDHLPCTQREPVKYREFEELKKIALGSKSEEPQQVNAGAQCGCGEATCLRCHYDKNPEMSYEYG